MSQRRGFLVRPGNRVRLVLMAAASVGVVIGLVLVAFYAFMVAPALPEVRDEAQAMNLGSIVYSSDGQEIGRFFDEDRIWVSFDSISPYAIDALIATEDHRFYDHEGVDLRRTLAAVYHTLRGNTQGASTISMQLARNLYPKRIGYSRTPVRKAREIITAVKLERSLSKDTILELYLNTVPFGNRAFGIESASRRYFDRPASGLELQEAALLIGLLKGSSWYNPLRHPERALARRNIVLQRMHVANYLTEHELEASQRLPVELRFQPGNPAGGTAPHFTDHVRIVAGEWADRNGFNLFTDGLRIHTTLDSRLQSLANHAVVRRVDELHAVAAYEWSRRAIPRPAGDPSDYLRRLEAGDFDPFGYLWQSRRDILDAHIRRSDRFRRLSAVTGVDEAIENLASDTAFLDSLRSAVARLEGALVAIDPATGYVKAWVGGRDYARDQYDKVALARRQPASTFKPFVFGAALEAGYLPHHRFADSLGVYRLSESHSELREIGTPDEALTLHQALALSNNAITTLLVDVLGPHEVARYARRLGIASRLDPVPSIGLGTSDVTLLELTAAYATIASHGIRTDPIVITHIEDRDGREVARFQSERTRVIPSWTSYTLLDMMRGVIDHGTGSAIRHRHRIGGDVAGKTGTSQNYADGWFVMMHPRLVTGVWVGFNDRRITFRSSTWGLGGRNALDVAGSFFASVTSLDPNPAARRFEPPVGYVAPRVGSGSAPPLTARKSEYDVHGFIRRDAFSEGLDISEGLDMAHESVPDETGAWTDGHSMQPAPHVYRGDEQHETEDPDGDVEAALRREVRGLDSD